MITDPRDARNARQLPDEAMWAVVCNPTMPAPALAAMLGTSANNIRNARYRFRRAGWSCRVAFVPCAQCGELVTIGGHVRRDRAYHRACKPAALKAIQRAIDKRRWERADVHERNHLLDKAKEHEQTWQVMTSETATHTGSRWTLEDEAVLIAYKDEPAHKLAERLGRTLYAIRSRQMRLRRRGLLQGSGR